MTEQFCNEVTVRHKSGTYIAIVAIRIMDIQILKISEHQIFIILVFTEEAQWHIGMSAASYTWTTAVQDSNPGVLFDYLFMNFFMPFKSVNMQQIVLLICV